jgi:hypothetical protein
MMAWHDMLGTSAAWWFPLALDPASRDDVIAAWEAAFAAAGLLALRGWPAWPDPSQQLPVLWQAEPELEAYLTVANPYSVYRTDGGHAAAQITVSLPKMSRAYQTSQSDSPVGWWPRRSVHPFR